MFKISDFYGIVAAGLSLILVYLILNKSDGFTAAVGSVFKGTSTLTKDLQGRG